MNREQIVNIAASVAHRHESHTVLLYGSWARGDASAGSDVDLLCVTDKGATMRDARVVDGVYVDAFIYPESALAVPDASLLRILGGFIVREREAFGRNLLELVRQLYDRGPDRMPDDERQARIVWAHKMLERIRGANDPDGNYRRMFLLMRSLEDYFELKNRWFRGSKEALGWLKQNDPSAYALFDLAFRPESGQDVIGRLVDAVYGAVPDVSVEAG